MYPFDFTTTDESAWSLLKLRTETLDVGLLVNNVAMNHAFPVSFMDEDNALIGNILQVCPSAAGVKLVIIHKLGDVYVTALRSRT